MFFVVINIKDTPPCFFKPKTYLHRLLYVISHTDDGTAAQSQYRVFNNPARLFKSNRTQSLYLFQHKYSEYLV